MKKFVLAAFAAALAASSLAMCATQAEAKPNVALKMSGFVVEGSGNSQHFVPIEQTQPRPGDVVRYVVVASNATSEAANKLIVAARVPAGTAFEPGSATSNAMLHPQFSLDGGHTWASVPMTTVHTASGDVQKKADPAAFTSVRWIFDKPLAAHSSGTYAYEVRVK